MMQGIHQQQQQLVALLKAAQSKDDFSKTPHSNAAGASISPPPEDEESSRLSALNSLHRAILFPPNSLLITHSASFLAQGFFQLLSDKLYSVRHASATSYGALCSVLCSISMSPNGRQNHAILGSVIDRFIGWSLPYLSTIDNGTSELALESLREFLHVGEVVAVERYALPILKACQELLEDERTSMNLLPRILAVLTLISLKFFRCFQPHFVDIVDLLLGWAMVPDISDPDKRVIMDSFLQFQKHWVNNMQFSLGLLSKFLGDMDMILQDGSPGTPQQFKRLLALGSCFCTVLQSVASGLLEINLLSQISEPLSQMVPVLLGCLSMVGRKFGWSKWIEDSWRCLTLLAEILGERFSTFYPIAVDILFQSLAVGTMNQVVETQKLSSFQVHGVLKTNLQLLSLQKFGLMPSSVNKILQFDGPISQLRLHPNHLVTGSAAASYLFLLRHTKYDVVEKTMDILMEELQLVKCKLEKISAKGYELDMAVAAKFYSKHELVALIKFNMKVLLSCVCLQGSKNLILKAENDSLYNKRAEKLVAYITGKLNPFNLPISSSVDLQVTLLRTLERLSIVEFVSKCSTRKNNSGKNSPEMSSAKHEEQQAARNLYPAVVSGHMRKYAELLVKALDTSSSLAVKVEALKWMCTFCESVCNVYRDAPYPIYPYEAFSFCKNVQDLLFSILVSASDREPKVRSLVATVLEMLLRAKIIHPSLFPVIAETLLEKLGDPEKDIKDMYLKLLSDVLPMAVYICGLRDSGGTSTCTQFTASADRCSLNWKQVFALKKMPQQLHSQQLVSVLSYISQRWKVPLSSWIQRLIHTCKKKKDHTVTQQEEVETIDPNALWLDINVEEDMVEKVCSVNLLAGSWWAIHEAARFCITTRLRTNLGGPTQTFAALERMLRDIAHVLQLETEQTDANLNIISSYAHLLPMRLLLEFVESLKKNVYNAYEGSSVLPHASRTSSLFFRANKKVCEEWFSRISEPMMDAGLAVQCYDATIYYCTLRLQDLSNVVASALKDKSSVHGSENLDNVKVKYAGDILRTVMNMALTLCRKNQPAALVGLQKWATMAFSPLFGEENKGSGDDREYGYFSWITGIIYQAGGQHEKAAAHLIHLLQDEESLASMGSDGVQFTIARIIESYTTMSDWKSLESWLVELQSIRAKHAGRSYIGALTTTGSELNSIQALARFDEGDFQAAWSYLDLTPKSSSEVTLDPRLSLQRSEQMLLQAMLLHLEGKLEKVPQELQKAKLMLEETFSVLPLDGLVEAAPYINQLHCISAFEEGFEHGDNQGKSFQSLLGTYIKTTQFPCNQVHQDCSLWLKLLRVCQNTQPDSPVTLELCKNVVILARKQSNLKLAARLNNYLKSHASLCSDESLRNYYISSMEYENILLMREENNLEGALKDLWSFVRPFMVSSSIVACDSRHSILKAKACLKLSKWLQGFSGGNLDPIVHDMQADFSRSDISTTGTEVVTFSDDGGSKARISLVVEELVGTARKSSTLICPMMGKTWISFASWCYTQARASMSCNHEVVLHSCSFSPILDSEIQPGRFGLTEEEKVRVRNIIQRLTPETSHEEPPEERKDINILALESIADDMKPLLQQTIDIIENEAGASGEEDCRGNMLSVALSSQLQKYLVSSDITLDEGKITSILGDLVDVWWTLRRRRVSLFGHAAEAFMNYLSFSTSNCVGHQLTGGDVEPKYNYVNYNLRAMLYVLQIMVKYGAELKDTLELAFAKVPILPWQEITPQLFAQLSSHPDKVVRKQLETLLVMLLKLSPWSLVYPTLVDANSPEKEPSEELQKILGYLKRLYPRLVQDVQLMIKELENVTVLWEELWLGTLHDLHADVMRRINLLKEEAARITENTTLSYTEKNKINSAKYSAMMAPIVVVLERRLTSTSSRAETPHEEWFLEEYQERIKSALMKFRTPPGSVAALGDVWRPFEAIAMSLASYQRKSSVSFREVAPQLASLLSSDAPMPGLEKQTTISESDRDSDSFQQQIVTVASFCDQLAILPTKTKPKKLVIVGSDGLEYTYLLKGREDLRLDARIMQLLQAVNGFLQSSSSTQGQSLGIRHYSVTPISGRAGLIQWVDNVISIYSVFKSWQNRVNLSQFSASGADPNTAVPPPVPRPSDMFYGKIIPALKEKGIRRVISRRDWPHDVKRKVLLDLMQETPKQLLHQELWCASEGFKSFSSKRKRYSGSLAAMSIVGHILGLGDRHLDNILIDFYSGDVVHIDYNVCFDKGQRLKIPEIVPFRLTQTLEAALGLTAIEGTFRENCEAVLGVLKKNKDIILMLLEVFVWDPLVEWTRANFHDDAAVVGEERKGMELAVSLSLFASRIQEIRVPLQEHHDLFLSTLPAVESAIEVFSSVLNQYEIVSNHFYQANQERSNLVLHEISAKSVVAEATNKSEQIQLLLERQAREFTQAQALVIERGKEAISWIEQHGRIIDALRNSSIPEIKVSKKLTGSGEAISLTSAVIGAGVPLTVVPEPTKVQCLDIDQEVCHFVSELDHGLSSAVAALQMYSLALQRIVPLNYLTTSPLYGWAQILLSLNTLSPDITSAARRQGAELVMKGHGDGYASVRNSYNDLSQKVTRYAAEIERLEEEYRELMASIGPGTESTAKEHLLTSFKNYIQHTGLNQKNNPIISGRMIHGATTPGEIEEKKASIQNILDIAVSNLFSDLKYRMHNSLDVFAGERDTSSGFRSELGSFVCEFDEQTEKCILVTEFVNELKHEVGLDIYDAESDANSSVVHGSWASIFKTSLIRSKELVEKMTEVVIPNVIKSIISYDSDVSDIFGSISHIRGCVDAALEQLAQVELERLSLNELQSNYFVKVGLITEQRLALEEASMNGRDNLSWEEAEELASQEERCRVQLDELHHTWNQKDLQTSALMKKEANISSTLFSSEVQLQALVTAEQESEPFILRRKALLAALLEPFSELESIDQTLMSLAGPISYSSRRTPYLTDLINSGRSVSEYIWKFPGLVCNHSFFIWKIAIVDLLLDSCTRDVSTSFDQNLGFDQLLDVVTRKLRDLLQDHISKYLRDRVAPIIITRLDQEIETLRQKNNFSKGLTKDQLETDSEIVRRVQLVIEEYCGAHETFRAAISAASIMKRQISELKDVLVKTSLEIAQMEWMYNIKLRAVDNLLKFLPAADDDLLPIMMSINRSKLLESLQLSVTTIAMSLESLQSSEAISLTAEGQLERAMSWACGGPSSSSAGNVTARNSGIPHQFHDHLSKRRHLLQEARENALDIMKVCVSILEFEASRDGKPTTNEISPSRSEIDGGFWQQSYLNALTNLDATYHSLIRAEQDCKLAQSNVEAASSGLVFATDDLGMASVKTKTASGDLQSTLLAMRDAAYEAGEAISVYGGIIRGHNALTAECGSMLEEVLAITKGLPDVHTLGKEAAVLHLSLMEELSKANTVLLPLDSLLSKDVTAITDSMARDKEIKMEIGPIHGQAIYQSYHNRLKETIQVFKPLVPTLTSSVKGLYSIMTRLGRAAGLHAGNLHKALEGLGESLEVKSQDVKALTENLSGAGAEYVNEGSEISLKSAGQNGGESVDFEELAIPDRGWISPPESISSGSSESCVSSVSENIEDSLTSIDTNLQPSCGTDSEETRCLPDSQSPSTETNSKIEQERPDAATLLSLEKVEIESRRTNFNKRESGSQAHRGKNAYAISILKRVEMKLDGWDITDNRDISIAEQVDFLLKQATNTDNLCNMYEGWTAWI